MTKNIKRSSNKFDPGSVRYEVIGYEQQADGLGGTINVPKYRRIETLPPKRSFRLLLGNLIAIVRSLWGRK